MNRASLVVVIHNSYSKEVYGHNSKVTFCKKRYAHKKKCNGWKPLVPILCASYGL